MVEEFSKPRNQNRSLSVVRLSVADELTLSVLSAGGRTDTSGVSRWRC